MSLRSEWQAAKEKAKKANNKKEVKFTTKLNLGPLLDTYEAAKKAHISQEMKKIPQDFGIHQRCDECGCNSIGSLRDGFEDGEHASDF